ncbi:MAG: T9SS type A sorting domain-containing protein, partial [Saprospiraceae bacterium]
FGMQGLSDGKRQIAWHTQQSFPDWTIPQLPTGNHRIQWIVVDGCGNESAPCEYSFTVMANNTVTTQEENPKNLAVWIYPNPAGGNDQLHLEYPGLMNGQFDLYDGRGRRVLSRSISGNQVVLAKPDLPAGLYYFQVRQNGKMRGSGKLSIL